MLDRIYNGSCKSPLYALSLLLACLATSPTAAEQGAPRPQVGDVFPGKEGAFKGWTIVGFDHVRIGQSAYALFFRNGTYLIALTRRIDRNPGRGVKIYKIVKTEFPVARANERILDDVICSPDGNQAPIIAFYDGRSRMVRGIFAAGGVLTTKKWLQDIDNCVAPGD